MFVTDGPLRPGGPADRRAGASSAASALAGAA